MLEIEVKSPCTDLEGAEKRLQKLGGRFDKELRQTDLYLAHPCRDFARTDEALRVRQENDRCFLVYKGPKVDQETKSREELDTPITDPESLKLVLSRLGFQKVAEVRKVRRVYHIKGVEVALDHVSGLGGFVELEVQDKELEVGRAMIRDLMKDLGLERTERRSYLELLLEKGPA